MNQTLLFLVVVCVFSAVFAQDDTKRDPTKYVQTFFKIDAGEDGHINVRCWASGQACEGNFKTCNQCHSDTIYESVKKDLVAQNSALKQLILYCPEECDLVQIGCGISGGLKNCVKVNRDHSKRKAKDEF
eukprot:TRINITY_DN1949_c0_g1_i1.p2 TRINITY_DN1949_c0_g1~~TRINITY_DN1949_c0_g1_i1.p2  ORF type:complete len:130 (-),score=42.99 TRINITY_DN1949_c0_g1_i1:221-610(-)